MSNDENVTIVSWPKEPAALEHHWAPEESCAVSISFKETPARVIVSTEPKQPVEVDMTMQVTAREPIPICIKLCEPICAKSDYTIGINIFDNPFASVNIRGLTRLYNCREQPPAGERICVGFSWTKIGMVWTAPVTHEGLTFTPLGTDLHAAGFGEPAGTMKLAFTPPGMRVDFPQAVEDVGLTINNYGSRELKFSAYAGTSLLTEFAVPFDNELKEVTLSQTGITALTIMGGNNEAGLVEICYRAGQDMLLARPVGR